MARNQTLSNYSIAALDEAQANVLRCLYEWCYIGRETARGCEVTRLYTVPAYVLKGELSGPVEEIIRTLRLLEDKGLIETEETRFALHPTPHLGWKLPDGKTLRILYTRETDTESGRKTVTVRVERDGLYTFTEAGEDTPPRRAYQLTLSGIYQAESGLRTQAAPALDQTDESARSANRKAELAYAMFNYATKKEPALHNATDKEVWNWLREHDDDELLAHVPDNLDTFSRYLRSARQARGEQKNSPVAGRRCRSAVRADEQ